MKKRIFFSLMFTFMLLAIPAQAQVRFGVKGGLDIAKLTFSDNLLKSDNKTGWFIGPTVEVKIPNVAIAIDAALLYTQNDLDVSSPAMGSKSTREFEGTLKQKTLQVPINLKIPIGPVYIAAGPQFGYNVGDKKVKEFMDTFEIKDFETSCNVGAGARLGHFEVGLTYNFSVDKMDDGGKYDVKKNTWMLSATVFF